MSQKRNRRKYERVEKEVGVLFDRRNKGIIQNINIEGLYAIVDDKIPLMFENEISIDLPNGTVTVFGTCLRCKFDPNLNKYKVAVLYQYDMLSELHQDRIRNFLETGGGIKNDLHIDTI